VSTPTQTQVGGDHYRTMRIQPERFIFENGIGFHEGSAIAYLCRWRKKGGVQDLEKAKHFIDLLIENEKRAQDTHPELPLVSPLTPPPGWRRMEGHERVDTVSYCLCHDGWKRFHSDALGKPAVDFLHRCITPVWHNPEGIPSPGEGYRFLLTSESETDATHFWTGYEWMDDDGGSCLRPLITYRTNKPLPCPPHNTTS
jgi:hypothetical protein